MLLYLNALMQGFWGVAREDRNSGLDQNGATIDFQGNEMDGTARYFDTTGEGLLNGVGTSKGGKQAGVDVEQTTGKGIDQYLGDDAHPTRHNDPVNALVVEGLGDRPIQCFPAGKLTVVEEKFGDTQTIGAFRDFGLGVVVDEAADFGVEFFLGDGVGDRLKVATTP